MQTRELRVEHVQRVRHRCARVGSAQTPATVATLDCRGDNGDTVRIVELSL